MNPESEKFAHEMDAAHYWQQFTATVYFDEPCEVVGLVERLTEEKTSTGAYTPKLRIRLADDTAVYVLATQARLVAALLDTRPRVGDRIRIRYIGEAKKAAAGMSKAKLFTVEVRRAETLAEESPDGHRGGTPIGAPRPGQAS